MQQRDVVEAVADQAQVGEDVADGLRVVVVAADGGDRLYPRRREGRLVDRRVGARLEQDRDVARAARAARDEVADARRDPGGLGVACGRVARGACDGAAHDGELHARPLVLGRRAGGDQRLVAAREAAPEQGVDGLQHARVRAVVAGQADDGAAGRLHLRTAAAEDVHVGAAEAVDRLALVPDGEAARGAGGDEVDDAALQGVRVLELVDQHLREAARDRLAHGGVALQQREGLQLEVVEVERAERPLAAAVGGTDGRAAGGRAPARGSPAGRRGPRPPATRARRRTARSGRPCPASGSASDRAGRSGRPAR